MKITPKVTHEYARKALCGAVALGLPAVVALLNPALGLASSCLSGIVASDCSIPGLSCRLAYFAVALLGCLSAGLAALTGPVGVAVMAAMGACVAPFMGDPGRHFGSQNIKEKLST